MERRRVYAHIESEDTATAASFPGGALGTIEGRSRVARLGAPHRALREKGSAMLEDDHVSHWDFGTTAGRRGDPRQEDRCEDAIGAGALVRSASKAIAGRYRISTRCAKIVPLRSMATKRARPWL
jgi:hypothetical protein